MNNQRWTTADIEDQTGRVAIVTGANSGIGYATALALARKGAHVVMACRNPSKATEAIRQMRTEPLKGELSFLPLDLCKLESVTSFAEQFSAAHKRLDLLVANAGVMMPPKRTSTEEGFELQLGTNHFGHFALVGRLLNKLVATKDSRIVVVSSVGHRIGAVNFDDLHWERRRYRKISSYGQSKLANLLFAYELQRRLDAMGAGTIAVAAHPGWTATNLQKDFGIARALNPFFGMAPEQGALPSLYAATAPGVIGGEYYGPGGFAELRGYPTRVSSNRASREEQVASRLWQVSEDLTGVRFNLGA